MSLFAEVVKTRASSGRPGAASSSIVAPVCAAILGLVLLYAAGFAQTAEIHNGAHDTRHSSGFPCH
jgi:cobalt transporter subunit CbtB